MIVVVFVLSVYTGFYITSVVVGLNTSPFPSIGTVAAPHVIVTPVFPYELPLIQPHKVQLRAEMWFGVTHKCGGRWWA